MAKATEYRVVWQDRYHHASAPVAEYESAETFQRMLAGVAYTSRIESRIVGEAAWTFLGALIAPHVDEVRGPLEMTGEEYRGSDARAHRAVMEAERVALA